MSEPGTGSLWTGRDPRVSHNGAEKSPTSGPFPPDVQKLHGENQVGLHPSTLVIETAPPTRQPHLAALPSELLLQRPPPPKGLHSITSLFEYTSLTPLVRNGSLLPTPLDTDPAA